MCHFNPTRRLLLICLPYQVQPMRAAVAREREQQRVERVLLERLQRQPARMVMAWVGGQPLQGKRAARVALKPERQVLLSPGEAREYPTAVVQVVAAHLSPTPTLQAAI